MPPKYLKNSIDVVLTTQSFRSSLKKILGQYYSMTTQKWTWLIKKACKITFTNLEYRSYSSIHSFSSVNVFPVLVQYVTPCRLIVKYSSLLTLMNGTTLHTYDTNKTKLCMKLSSPYESREKDDTQQVQWLKSYF